MRRNLLYVIAMSCCVTAFSQTTPPGNRTKTPEALFRIDSLRQDIRERLVQLAMQNPSIEVDDRNVNVAAYGVKRAKSNILNQIALQGNVNEFSIVKNSTAANLYPKYNIGFILPLGTFATRSQDIHIARENLSIAVAQRSDHYRILRETVLSKYEDYLMAVDLLNFQRQLVEDVYTHYLKMEKSFAEAKITEEEYTSSYRNYNTEQAKQRTMERNLKVAVLEIERYIGVKLEDVLKEYR
jgi:outer membrane protein TolC